MPVVPTRAASWFCDRPLALRLLINSVRFMGQSIHVNEYTRKADNTCAYVDDRYYTRMSMTIGQRLKQRREACGLTQHELAKRSGTTQATIARIETGETASPRTSNLVALARALSTSSDYLSGEADDPGPLPAPEPLSLTTPAPEARQVEYDTTAATAATISTYGAQPWYPPMERVARQIPPRKPAWTWRDVRETHPARASKVPVTPKVLAELAQYYWENFPPPPDADDLEEAERRR